MILSRSSILELTTRGLLLYKFVFQEKFPRKNALGLIQQGLPVPNPFVLGGQLLIRLDNGIYTHQDLHQASFKGDAFDFANQYFRAATLPELYYLLNQNLRLGLKIPAEDLLDQLLLAEKDAQLPKLSYFQPPIQNIIPSETLNLPQLFQRITGPDYQQQTQSLRQLTDPKQRRQYKATHFPYVSFAGTFERRGDRHLLQPSGLLVIDLDDLPDPAPVREALIAAPAYETELLFVSPSGNGLKWVTSYPYEEISHSEYFRELSSYLEAMYQVKPDESGKDISRACFLSHDPDAFLSRKYLFHSEPPQPP